MTKFTVKFLRNDVRKTSRFALISVGLLAACAPAALPLVETPTAFTPTEAANHLGADSAEASLEDDHIIDLETGSVWDLSRDWAKEGLLAGEGLQPLPSLSSYDWAFEDFYPQGDFYQP